jgi:hypothetical protein|tara:strand:- start:81 stop:698 length:618 start_codon:yes stop_codon:yes gene_type:complete
MATASLSKFTVPLSTNQSATSQGLLMPKLKFRFRVTFENFGVSQPSTELTKQVIDFTRPKLSFEEMIIPIYNSKVYLAGKPTWETVVCTLRDDAGGEVTKRVGEQLQKQFDFMEQASASSGIDYKFLTRFEVLDGGNGVHEATVLETWELYGCYLSNTDYADANYATNEPMTVAMTIRYDNAIQTPLETGIGTLVGRTLGTTITG